MVDEQAAHTPGKRSLAMEAFARALRAIPSIISDNAGGASVALHDPSPCTPHTALSVPLGVPARHSWHGDVIDERSCRTHVGGGPGQ